MNETLIDERQIENHADRYAIEMLKYCKVAVHLHKGSNGHSAQTIFYLVRSGALAK